MKNFIKTILIFLGIPFLLITTIDTFILPLNFWGYRIFEGIVFDSNLPHLGNFYSKQKITMLEYGDLAHHTNDAISKKNTWITDELGFRNDKFIEQADILLIGDSFFHGTSLSQAETFPNVLTNKLGKSYKVYNMAVSSLSEFDCFYQKGFIKKPKMIIIGRVERSEPISFNRYKLQNEKKLSKEIKNYWRTSNKNQ